MILYKIVKVDEEWDSKLFELKNWNIFQTSVWITRYTKVFFPTGEAKGLLFYDGDSFIGAIPIISIRKFFLKINGSPIRHALTPFIGLAFKENEFEKCFIAIIDFMKNTKINILTVTQGELFPNDIIRIGYCQHNIFTTSVISLLQSEDELWKNFESKTRNQIRKGEKNNFTVSADLNAQTIDSYLKLRIEMYRNQDMEYELSNDFLINILNSLPSNYIRLLSITYEGKLISAGLFLLFNGVCYYWDGVSRAEYNKLCPNNVIQWSFIKWAKRNGFLWYDLGGTNTPSIAHFKNGYGGIQRKYSSVQIFHPKVLSRIWNFKKRKAIKQNPRLSNNVGQK